MPANTARGYPYPLPTEPVTEGAQAIRNLAEKVDTKAGVDLISKVTIATPGTITFPAIPQLYTHLQLELSGRSNAPGTSMYAGADFVLMTLGGGSTYGAQWHHAAAAVHAAVNYGEAFARIGLVPDPVTGSFGALTLRLPNYRSTASKTWHCEGFSPTNVAPGLAIFQTGGLCTHSVALSSLVLSTWATNFAAGTIASLYGIY